MVPIPPEPTLHLQSQRRGLWTTSVSRRVSLEVLETQMRLIDSYRGGNWPQRIVDDDGRVLLQNEAARQLTG